MNNEIVERIDEIKNDTVHGAGYLTQKALATLIATATASSVISVAELLNEINEVALELKQARPIMVSIANYITKFVNIIMNDFQQYTSTEMLKNAIVNTGDTLIAEFELAKEKAAEYGAHVLNDGDTILTCSYSSLIISALIISKNRGNKLNVFVTESKWSDISYGKMTVSELTNNSISAKVIPDSEIKRYLDRITIAVTGADCILADGTVINGKPSLQLAQRASSAKLRYYVMCETAKFDLNKTKNKDSALEEGFDLIPSNLITGLITEKGIMSPSEIAYFLFN